MSKQLGFAIEQNRCMGCKACQIACKDKNNLGVGQFFREVIEVEGGSYLEQGAALKPQVYAYWISLSCNHCQKPACLTVCPVDAITKREEDGLVIIEQKKCIGCRKCEQSCPYDAPQYLKKDKQVAKCDYCIELVKQGKKPTCVAACPMRALDAASIAQLEKEYDGIKQVKEVTKSVTNPSIIIVPHSAIKNNYS
ncbi:dimethylsulfoxide reductase subunit B [Natroniella sulfidigena]|uniref:DMSO/selenate family reductase complex B subunit n=1 Tax=Natroniella sulfidigena TaxID=723921 RepID=UPI00200B4BA3|nr:DMSO/selenate family reductase complex B subunit [Natroniella sulfidigena]MCK8817848.1 dimethylsulfoxide reductase subunit B [Natroniella sulfidigena]